ncbi:uncharacterized GPI-anchored protein At5g19250-like [Punica granatum]|uniref:Uncharacterized GPI-anchored protein At5g19230-like domain-containing protein n=2 Tax=Punica granatum TaxID=22663 RepID=A0A218VR18_PUNGR|nr:uncharacterized GPI-anchored protein At5g19250-like [Punica granatum]OWM62945.1 hypothetical protein CDL15_Pgr020239 [Punica granatum]PKI51554.1 hypothetical protein CRG98_028114 [Punica granatum]
MSKHSLSKFGFAFGLLVPAILLLPHPVACDEDRDNLLQGINSYRTSLNLLPLAKNDRAGCLADGIADQLEDHPCVATTTANAIPGTGPQLSNYPNLLSKCGIHINNTRDGVILPVCVHNRVPTLVLTNYTRTGYAGYLNDSRFTGAGIGVEDNWIVVILATSTQQGSFASGSSLGCELSTGLGFICLAILGLILYSH